MSDAAGQAELEALARLGRLHLGFGERKYERWAARPHHVYFVQAGADGPIKIGFSRALSARIKKMRADCPYELTLLAHIDGGQDVEQDLHERFAHLRLRGEWFSPGPDLLEYIEALQQAVA
jgi:hypothetical protein